MSGPVSIGMDRAEIPADSTIDVAWSALRSVYDPELYLDVVSLGLVYDVREEDGTIVVEMTLTTPGCPASESLPEMARAAISQSVGNPTVVDVRIVWDPPWSPALMDAEAAAALGFRVRK
jgi:metal-sulfur cluster biosynthetic enzyme